MRFAAKLAGKAIMGEQALIAGARYDASSYYSWPMVTDDLLTAKGGALKVYRAMRSDPMVKDALTIRVGGLFRRGWKLIPGAEQGERNYDRAIEQAKFVKWVFDDMHGSVDDFVKETAKDAICYGSGIPELVWRLLDNGPYAGNLAYKAIKPKAPWAFYAEMDDYGNQTGLVQQVDGAIIHCDLSKFAILRFETEHGNPAGVSELRGAYRFYYIKDKMTQYWSIFEEKYGSPTAKGSYKRGLPTVDQEKLRSVLDSIQQETAIVLPDDVTVELMEAARSGDTSGFERFIAYCDKQMAICLLGQTLTTGEGNRSGSFALGSIHADQQDIIINDTRRMVEQWMDESIIRPLIYYNFSEPYYPNFSLPLDEKNIAALAQPMFQLVSCGIVDARESCARDILGLPEREELPPLELPILQVGAAQPKEADSVSDDKQTTDT
jgi:phage gp29-like protein